MTVSAPPTWTTADFWKHIYGETPGLIAAFSGKRNPGEQELKDERSRYFQWPSQAHAAEQWLRSESARGRCAYICAHLINEPTDEEKDQGTKPRRIKANAAAMLALYVDGDGASIPNTLPRPTAVVQSSPGREQAYWKLTHAIDPARGEQLNKRLASAIGADMSGWDLTQLLRAPGTRNHKYEDRPVVRVTAIEDLAYDPDELERVLPPLPQEQTKERPAVKIEPTVGPIGDRDRRALEKMRASKRGAEIAMLEAGGSKFSKPDGSPDGNRDDLSLLSGYAFWLDKDPVRMAHAAEQTARVRPKWYERHYASGETYLEHSIGQAIAGCSQSFRELNGHDAGDDPPSIGRIQFTTSERPASTDQAEGTIPGEPTTLEEAMIEIRRLRRRALDQDDKIEMLTGVIEDQQQVIAATRAERDQLAELRAIDRRAEMAKQRIRRAYKPGQADTIIAVAQIAPPIANAHQTDEPIITREMIAETNSSHPSSAGENAKVFDQPGSPIQRIPKTLGTKSLTAYKLGGLGTVEILEKMADLGETLDRATPTRAKRVRCERCPDGTTQTLAIICDGCNGLLSKRQVTPLLPTNASETRALDDPPPSVNVLVTHGARNACVAGRPESRQPVSIGQIRMTHHQEPPRPRCARAGCDEPAANGFICAAHLRGDVPAVMGAET